MEEKDMSVTFYLLTYWFLDWLLKCSSNTVTKDVSAKILQMQVTNTLGAKPPLSFNPSDVPVQDFF